VGLCFHSAGASASTINFSGAFFTVTGAAFDVGQAFSGTLNYDSTTAIFLGGTSSFAQYTENTHINVSTGGKTYEFPLWEIFVQANDIHETVQFIATDFSTFLLIELPPTQSALLPPEIVEPLPGGIFHLVSCDIPVCRADGFTSQASGVFTHINVTPLTAAVPGPIVGAGLPGLIFAGGVLLAWRRKRSGAAIAA
jgi:hypothetical protein